MDKQRKYVSKDQLYLLGDTICIWGTGVDAEVLIKNLDNQTKVKFFIDTFRCGNYYHGLPVISYDEYKRDGYGIPIVVASYRFAEEIVQKIDEDIDVYIWDDQYIFTENQEISDFVQFNTSLWEERSIESEDQVLIPFDNRHSVRAIIHSAYCADFFAHKYQASIYGYFRFGGTKKIVSPVVLQVYQSVNMKDVIDPTLTETQREEAERIADELWANLHTWEDWKVIVIKDIPIGNTIIRHYLRHYMPVSDPREDSLRRFLNDAIETFLFWFYYLRDNRVKAVCLADGVCWDGYIRDIAVHFGIPVYMIDDYFQKATANYHRGAHFPYLREFWDELSDTEKEYGIEWARNELQNRVQGKTEFLSTSNDKNIYSCVSKESVLEKNDKLKVMICPHIFEEDSYWCGEQVFDDNYMAWLGHLGALSQITPQYDWYIKVHPSANNRDLMIMDEYVNKYTNIKKLPKEVSPRQLASEGMKWAFTVCGTISQEYPLLGIQVINAGHNPGEQFDFAWNPKSKTEFDDLVMHLEEQEPKLNEIEIYKFYSTNYYYYHRQEFHNSRIFFDDVRLEWNRPTLLRNGLDYGPWQYAEYMKHFTSERHIEIIKKMPRLFHLLDEWKPNVFYREDASLLD